jgi:hypothetical protein
VASTRMQRLARRAVVVTVTLGAVLGLAGMAFAAVPLTTVSTDPYTNTSSFHQTQLEPDTYSSGSTIMSVFQTGRFSDGGASNIGYATSTNGGQTWTNGFLPGTTVYATPAGPWARISDPSVAFDPKHNVWLVTGLAIDASATGKAAIVNRSTDGGLTFSNPVTVSVPCGFCDKEWIACDQTATSPFFGNCYVEWDDAGAGNKLHMAFSTDGGQTWSQSGVPGNSTGVIGGQPLVQPNGTVVMPIGGGIGLESFISTNGGSTYTGPFNIASVNVHFVNGNLRDGGGLPSAEIDASGKVYVVWQDCRFRASCSSNDILMSTSTNGQTWAAPVRIPIDLVTSTVDHFIPGIAVDPATSGSTARLGLTYYFYPTANCSTSTCKLSAGFVSSTNGGSTWSRVTRILGSIGLKSLPLTNQGYMVGDYISTSFSNGQAFPIVANATQGNCQKGNITSCHEFMVTAAGGLILHPGTRPVGTERPVFTGPSGYALHGLGTRF